MPEVICIGEALIDFVATEAGTSVGESPGFVRAPGGAPANVAVGVVRLGRSSAFLGKVGDDPFGRFIERTLAGAGVDTGGMVFDPKRRTGLAFVSLTPEGERDFCFFRNPSADMTFDVLELDLGRIASGRILHFGSITLIDRAARAATLAAVRAARAGGLLISYDPNLRPPLWPSLGGARRTILRGAAQADVMKVSEEELYFLTGVQAGGTTGTPVESTARRLMARLPLLTLLAVTRGVEGCFWLCRNGQTGFAPGVNTVVVDTTGAGDGFVAAVLVGLLDHDVASPCALREVRSKRLAPIFDRANVVGALTTMHKGAIPALPTAAEADMWRAQAPGVRTHTP